MTAGLVLVSAVAFYFVRTRFHAGRTEIMRSAGISALPAAARSVGICSVQKKSPCSFFFFFFPSLPLPVLFVLFWLREI